jgi:hypothetical protein
MKPTAPLRYNLGAYLLLVRPTRALSIATVFFGVPWVAGYGAIPPLIEIPVTISQGASVRVPFSVIQTGTYDLELQYRAGVETYYNSNLNRKLRRELAGTVTLSCGGRTLKHNLPTGWGRAFPGRVATVIVRFRAEAQKRYLCLLRMKHVPPGLPQQPFVVVRYVTPHFHPGNHVYELQ